MYRKIGNQLDEHVEVRIDGEIVVRNRQADIADPAGGGVVDSECRGAVAEILSAMRVHGLIG